MFHTRMATTATLMLASVMMRLAMTGEAMRHVRSILRIPVQISTAHGPDLPLNIHSGRTTVVGNGNIYCARGL